MQTAQNPTDGQKVVIQNGQRVTGTMSEHDAAAEAARRNKIVEGSGNQVPEAQRATVKTNLCG